MYSLACPWASSAIFVWLLQQLQNVALSWFFSFSERDKRKNVTWGHIWWIQWLRYHYGLIIGKQFSYISVVSAAEISGAISINQVASKNRFLRISSCHRRKMPKEYSSLLTVAASGKNSWNIIRRKKTVNRNLSIVKY